MVQDDENSKGTAMDDDIEGDTQQVGCSNASHSATRSLDVNIPPTQVLYFKLSTSMERSEFLQFTRGDNIGGTQLDNDEVGFTQIANVDAGCTQLLVHEPNMIGTSFWCT